MRLWSIHPQYLDSKGLVALWREGLLAKKVLEGRTKGYTNHPQLKRFKEQDCSLDMINVYLSAVYEQSLARGYHFNIKKINYTEVRSQIPLTRGQLDYEFNHLKCKLKKRDKSAYRKLLQVSEVVSHPIFYICEGGVAEWEMIK